MKNLFFSVLLTVILIAPVHPLLAGNQEDSGNHQEQKEGEAPKADSVWGAMKYSGHHIKKGSIKAGHGIKYGGVKAGQGIKTGGKAMGRGFKKAGGSIKKFFVGKD